MIKLQVRFTFNDAITWSLSISGTFAHTLDTKSLQRHEINHVLNIDIALLYISRMKLVETDENSDVTLAQVA